MNCNYCNFLAYFLPSIPRVLRLPTKETRATTGNESGLNLVISFLVTFSIILDILHRQMAEINRLFPFCGFALMSISRPELTVIRLILLLLLPLFGSEGDFQGIINLDIFSSTLFQIFKCI